MSNALRRLSECWSILLSLGLMLGIAIPAVAQVPEGEQLPGTEPLMMTEPLHVVMVRGINQFAEQELVRARELRPSRWTKDFSSEAAYLTSVAPQRQQLRTIIGAVDPLVEPRLRTSDVTLLTADAETAGRPQPVQWDVLEGVAAEGLLLRPRQRDEAGKATLAAPRAAVVLMPDPQQTPEMLCGLESTLPPEMHFARRLADSGCLVLVLTPISRETTCSVHPSGRGMNVSHRELVYRCGFELGRHPLGYEVQMAIQARTVLRQLLSGANHQNVTGDQPEPMIGIAGVGDGAAVAMLAAASEPAFDACYVGGYFDQRESVWQQPIDRNLFGQLTSFGDAELAGLIAPRPLTIDNSIVPPLFAGPTVVAGQLSFAAPGRIVRPDSRTATDEYLRAEQSYKQLGRTNRIHYYSANADRHTGDPAGWKAFLKSLGISTLGPIPEPSGEEVQSTEVASRQKRLVESLIRHTQMVLHRSDKVREKLWQKSDASSLEGWLSTSQAFRDQIHNEMIGRLPLPTAPLKPRSRRVMDEPTHTGWEVVLDVYPPDSSASRAAEGDSSAGRAAEGASSADRAAEGAEFEQHPGVIAGGVLLLPKGMQSGERRPVVVCQHGLEGTPFDTITTDQSSRAWQPYKGFSTELVRRGFIVYVPQNPYKGGDEFRVIQRKSNPIGRSLFSYIIEQHRQTLNWLATLPYVDEERIAFYGLSYGGKTAVRVPPLLESSSPADSPRYCLSICSADFNEWIRKNASAEDRYSYVFTNEYEMFEWNMGHLAGYAELANLMTPRPFMVERGHGDGVAPDEWVAWEFAKVRRHYDRLGLGDRCQIEWFNGPHTINGQETYRFLHRHLQWPEP